MTNNYVPILKCKKGEQNALENLTDNIKNNIVPLIEIPYTETTSKKKTDEWITSFWEKRKFYFYFFPEWYEHNIDTFSNFVDNNISLMCNNTYGIPVLDLSYVTGIEDWSKISQNGIAIRLRNNEFGQIEEILNPLFNTGSLNRQKTDLIMDLQYVSLDDLFAKKAMLKAALSDLDNATDFQSIIISSASFPKQLPNMENEKIYRFNRVETEIHVLSKKLSERFGFNYIYSDYGPSDIEDTVFVPGMSPNFKIKYTTKNEYIYIKGYPLKKGGLDIGNVSKLSKILVNSKDFMGDSYSWGDNKIHQLATGQLTSPGNLTTWVGYIMNHHITFISQYL